MKLLASNLLARKDLKKYEKVCVFVYAVCPPKPFGKNTTLHTAELKEGFQSAPLESEPVGPVESDCPGGPYE